jgi:HSP20 family protein
MSLRSWNWRGLAPLHLEETRRDLDKLLNRTFGKIIPPQPHATLRAWSPDFDMFERDNQIVVKVDLPGISKDNINISIMGDTLTIYGDRKTNEQIDADDYYYRRRPHGKFRRDIELPQGVDVENIKASYNNGLLELVMPEKEGAKPRKVKVSIE